MNVSVLLSLLSFMTATAGAASLVARWAMDGTARAHADAPRSQVPLVGAALSALCDRAAAPPPNMGVGCCGFCCHITPSLECNETNSRQLLKDQSNNT
jgi:hypothetical protein